MADEPYYAEHGSLYFRSPGVSIRLVSVDPAEAADVVAQQLNEGIAARKTLVELSVLFVGDFEKADGTVMTFIDPNAIETLRIIRRRVFEALGKPILHKNSDHG